MSSLSRFYASRDAKDGMLYTGKSDDPTDKGADNFEPGIYKMVDVAQSDDVLDRD
jgi:hypothetical protein